MINNKQNITGNSFFNIKQDIIFLKNILKTILIYLMQKNFIVFYYLPHLLYALAFYFINQPIVVLWVLYVLVPVVDELLPQDWENPIKEIEEETSNTLKFKFPLYSIAALDWIFTFYALHKLVHDEMTSLNRGLLVYQVGALALFNVGVGHELYHKDQKFDKFVGTYTMIKNLKTHYAQEHVFSHHRHIGTSFDPVSAPKGTSFWAYFGQAIVNQYMCCWQIEVDKPLLSKKIFHYTMEYILFTLFIYHFYGGWGTYYFLIWAFLASFTIVAADYTEHYGLRRKEISPGIFEPVQHKHAWNSANIFSNYLLLKQQRHSDHHVNPYKDYQNLYIKEDYPIFPCNFLSAILLTQFPSTWFDVMDPLIGNKKELPNARAKVQKFQLKFAIIASLISLGTILV
ncbi:hypothetical protein pb186bvf_013877 [Paramecium bursaria]